MQVIFKTKNFFNFLPVRFFIVTVSRYRLNVYTTLQFGSKFCTFFLHHMYLSDLVKGY